MHSRRTPRQTGNPSHQHRPAASERASRGSGERWLYGRHTVTAALANPERRWRRLAVLAGQETEAQQILAAAVAERRGGDGAALDIFDRDAFSALLPPGAVHQGLALEVEPLPEPDLDALLREIETASGRCVIISLDQVSDPQNVGAVLRSAAAFDARGVMIAAHGAPPDYRGPCQGRLGRGRSRAVDPHGQSGARPGAAKRARLLGLRARRNRRPGACRHRPRSAHRARPRLGGGRHAASCPRALRLSRAPADLTGAADA